MAKGIIYIMETVVPGLIKIGKTGSENFEQRMYSLERNGYNNVVGLKRRFAVEVEDYDAKEALLDSLFDRSRLQNSELFALDIDMAIQLLSSFDGRQVYPKNETKERHLRRLQKIANSQPILRSFQTVSTTWTCRKPALGVSLQR